MSLFPWPIPSLNSRTHATEFTPVIGRTARRFHSMYAAQEYAIGYSRRECDLELESGSSSDLRLGWLDADADITRKPLDRLMQEMCG